MTPEFTFPAQDNGVTCRFCGYVTHRVQVTLPGLYAALGTQPHCGEEGEGASYVTHRGQVTLPGLHAALGTQPHPGEEGGGGTYSSHTDRNVYMYLNKAGVMHCCK